MKIALLHYSVPPIVGGVESVIGHHARLMADAGNEVILIAGRGSQTDQRIPYINIPLADSRHPEILAAKAELDKGSLPTEFKTLVEKILNDLKKTLAGVELLIAHNVCSLNKNLPLTEAVHILSQSPKMPRLILWHHDLAWTTPRYRDELHPGYPWDLLKSNWPGVTQIVVSEPRRKELSELLNISAKKVEVVPNGVDAVQFLKLDKQTQEFNNQLNCLSANPLLLLPVRITPRKNIELAIRSLAKLKKHFPDAAVVVTGPLGPHNPANLAYFDQLKKLRAKAKMEGSFHFLAEFTQEYIPDEVIADFYRLADALFLPSREEGFGIPILEAGLVGLPIFCTDIESLKNIGRDFVTYFSPDADPEAVAALIVDRLAADPIFGLRKQIKGEYIWQRIYDERIQPLLHRNGG